MQPMQAEGHQGPRRAWLLLAAAHDLVRAGLRSLLAGEPDLEVTGQAMSGGQAITCCAAPRPDLVLIDIGMPQLDGLRARGHPRDRSAVPWHQRQHRHFVRGPG